MNLEQQGTKRCPKHKWHIVSYWKVIDVVVVRRICSACDKRQDADVGPDYTRLMWRASPQYELSG
jgi:hypothetical protein